MAYIWQHVPFLGVGWTTRLGSSPTDKAAAKQSHVPAVPAVA